MKLIRMRDNKVIFENENKAEFEKWVNNNCRLGEDGLPYYKNSLVYLVK